MRDQSLFDYPDFPSICRFFPTVEKQFFWVKSL